MKTYTIKPLVWKKYGEKRFTSSRWNATTILGDFELVGDMLTFNYIRVDRKKHTIETAKAAAEQHWVDRLSSALVEFTQ